MLADNYFILKDFDSYVEAQKRVDTDYRDELSGLENVG